MRLPVWSIWDTWNIILVRISSGRLDIQITTLSHFYFISPSPGYRCKRRMAGDMVLTSPPSDTPSLIKNNTLTSQSTFQPGTDNCQRSRRPRISFRWISQVNSSSSSSTSSRPKRESSLKLDLLRSTGSCYETWTGSKSVTGETGFAKQERCKFGKCDSWRVGESKDR